MFPSMWNLLKNIYNIRIDITLKKAEQSNKQNMRIFMMIIVDGNVCCVVNNLTA